MGGGLIFNKARERMRGKLPPILGGIGYGLGIWLVSYCGWVPSLGLMPHAKHDRPGRVWTMIAAHVIYGAALGAGARVFGRGGAR